MKEIYRSCNLCEAICGLRFEMEGDKILSIRADKEDPFSTGHICPKGPELKTIYEDKDRLRFPVKRIGSKWERISYEDAYIEVAESIHKIQTKYGDDSIGAYLGNPSVHNYGTILFGSKFFNKLKTRNLFSASSVDQLPHHFAAHFMFGHHFILPIPDIDRTDYFLMMGANPLASKGSMMTAPNINKRLKNLKERGAKLVVIDPRRTETAEIADRHLFIQPETDAFLLLSFLYILFTRNTLRLKRFENHISGIGELKDFVLAYPPGRTSAITGISEEALQQIVTEFTSSKRALVYGRIGLSVQRFGGLCQFLINSINLLSGNFDEPGGAMFTLPAVDILSLSNDSECGFNRWRSKARNLPEFNGEFPVSALADEILHPEGIKG
ncbi:MAG: molybdopterin-dependent oxidoreductase, partial [Leptospiraceae bacterium]|nr:molybdopterin-dependent oxidoreductase [Leptospiraceae bacterium]